MRIYKCYKCLAVLLVLILLMIILKEFFLIEKGVLSKKQLIMIAKKAIMEELNMDPESGKLYFDNGNKIWNKYFAEKYPNLSNYDYQAIRFVRNGPITIGGGSCWMCIDKKTGEVLQYDICL